MLSNEATARLEDFTRKLRGAYATPHQHPVDVSRAIDLFFTLHQMGDAVFADDVTRWAEENDWSADEARELGMLADAVTQTLLRVEE